MTNKTNFALLWSDALQSDNHDRFVSEWATSSMFDCDLAKSAEYVSKIWQIAHMSIRDMRDTTGLTQSAFAKLIGVPVRTLTSWEQRGGVTDYHRLWLAVYLGLWD